MQTSFNTSRLASLCHACVADADARTVLLDRARAKLREAVRDAARDGLRAIELGIRADLERLHTARDVRGDARAESEHGRRVARGLIGQRDRLKAGLVGALDDGGRLLDRRRRIGEHHARAGEAPRRHPDAARRHDVGERARAEHCDHDLHYGIAFLKRVD